MEAKSEDVPLLSKQSQLAVLALANLFLYSIAMFTLPFVAFFGIRHILVNPRPRYVRVNTNLLTTSDAIRAFQDEGYRFIRCTSTSYNDYLIQIQKLTEYDFMQDYHIKTILVFAPGTKLHDHELYLENKIILQDKATAMAVHLLAPPTGSVALDMCAAPGMKTTQLAAHMRNQGKIYAVERNEKRYETLCDFVNKTGSQCVETIHKDALEIKRGEYSDVEYILLDPSCSGSGMELSVHNYIDGSRLAKLTSLQEKFLKHAMNAFPNAKRIVYSTCSVFHEENERVISNIVKTSRAKWRVQDGKELLKDQWNNIGSAMYGSIGTRCLYANPETDFTTGFFVAVLDRDQKDLEKSKNSHRGNVENVDTSSKLQEKPAESFDNDNVEQIKPEDNSQYRNSKKKKKRKEADSGEDQDKSQVCETLSQKKYKKRELMENASALQATLIDKKSHNFSFETASLNEEKIDENGSKHKVKKIKRKHLENNYEPDISKEEKADVSSKKKKHCLVTAEVNHTVTDLSSVSVNKTEFVENKYVEKISTENILESNHSKKKKKREMDDDATIDGSILVDTENTNVKRKKKKKKEKLHDS